MSRLISMTGFTFERSMAPASSLRVGAGRLGGRAVEAKRFVALVVERLRVGEAGEPQPAALALVVETVPSARDLDAGFLRAERDRRRSRPARRGRRW